MNYKIESSAPFERALKKLAKKYHSLKNELPTLFSSLQTDPTQGTSLGQNCYKIRLAISSKGAGKRGGARVITYVVTDDERVVLLTIYDKKNKSDLEPGELDNLLDAIVE